ncbi:MAG: putative toxin-antitoxin system toxin component, PIN family [Thermoleophilaceae bacterium]
MRAVLDPNVVISGLLSRGSPAKALVAWQEGRFELVVSPPLLGELERALAYPKLRARIPRRDAEAALRWLSQSATVVDHPPEEPPFRSEDPGDDHLIALAAAERAALVSGDKHLLALADRIPVYSPREFVDLL